MDTSKAMIIVISKSGRVLQILDRSITFAVAKEKIKQYSPHYVGYKLKSVYDGNPKYLVSKV